VFWWFERRGQFLRYEVRELPDRRLELRVIDIDGSERAEQFIDSADLNKRQIEFERGLAADGWTAPSGGISRQA
jgi:hypothetical protein